MYFFGSWLAWALLHSAVLYWFNLSYETAILDSLISNTLLAAACYFISSNLQYYRPGQARLLYFGIWCLLLSGLWLLVINGLLPLVIEKRAGIRGIPNHVFARSVWHWVFNHWLDGNAERVVV